MTTRHHFITRPEYVIKSTPDQNTNPEWTYPYFATENSSRPRLSQGQLLKRPRFTTIASLSGTHNTIFSAAASSQESVRACQLRTSNKVLPHQAKLVPVQLVRVDHTRELWHMHNSKERIKTIYHFQGCDEYNSAAVHLRHLLQFCECFSTVTFYTTFDSTR